MNVLILGLIAWSLYPPRNPLASWRLHASASSTMDSRRVTCVAERVWMDDDGLFWVVTSTDGEHPHPVEGPWTSQEAAVEHLDRIEDFEVAASYADPDESSIVDPEELCPDCGLCVVFSCVCDECPDCERYACSVHDGPASVDEDDEDYPVDAGPQFTSA